VAKVVFAVGVVFDVFPFKIGATAPTVYELAIGTIGDFSRPVSVPTTFFANTSEKVHDCGDWSWARLSPFV
jgi:hypothetical protein